MAGRRAYRRDSRGRFAGSGGRVTFGNAGGFANAGHRANVQALRNSRPMSRGLVSRQTRNTLLRQGGKVVGAAAAAGLAAALVGSAGDRNRPGGVISAIGRHPLGRARLGTRMLRQGRINNFH